MNNNVTNAGSKLLITISAFLLALAFFYGLNHLVMSIQGLPLNLDLTPIS